MTMPSPSPTPQAGNPQRAPLVLQWGRDENTDETFEARVSTREELADVLTNIHTQALREGIACMTQIWSAQTMRQRGPGPAEPEVLIEAIVGDPRGAGLRWLGDDDEVQAASPSLAAPNENITFDNAGSADSLPPSVFRLSIADVQNILIEYLEKGSRTTSLSWTRLTFLNDPEP
ncbi:Imm1 family immunity protein [Kineosporia sp. NBRC 101731]|uniref:Imm1 family immunity protein n=1 Tax=Kineosporia sp. NBRC 101731 TaxID=3032199 RepID=UPI0024A2138F|nr:Imm1 family immunity protein [Kineosporia sp. NBRC 101731]GLY33381.1 hypothetical protein Kisp02_67460 [Kineosporia sp. NBRC 101731]